MTDSDKRKKSELQADAVAARQQNIQAEQNAKDDRAQAPGNQTAGNAKAEAAPGPEHAELAPPLPSQTLAKPGLQAEMQL